MKMTVNHPTYGEIVYAEGFWLGKKTLTVNGVEAAAVSKREFQPLKVGVVQCGIAAREYAAQLLKIILIECPYGEEYRCSHSVARFIETAAPLHCPKGEVVVGEFALLLICYKIGHNTVVERQLCCVGRKVIYVAVLATALEHIFTTVPHIVALVVRVQQIGRAHV